ncbi:MAG: hypothetical protein RI980_1127 [Bacteroidota bacterium]|jgi:hypothetical protein
MIKKIIILITIIIVIIVIGIVTYKTEKKFDNFTIVKIENNPLNFGTISRNDTIKHIFKITNTTKTVLVIDKVLSSCPCLFSKTDKKFCKINETANIEVILVPKSKQIGKIMTIVFVQCNANKGILRLELTGNIK